MEDEIRDLHDEDWWAVYFRVWFECLARFTVYVTNIRRSWLISVASSWGGRQRWGFSKVSEGVPVVARWIILVTVWFECPVQFTAYVNEGLKTVRLDMAGISRAWRKNSCFSSMGCAGISPCHGPDPELEHWDSHSCYYSYPLCRSCDYYSYLRVLNDKAGQRRPGPGRERMRAFLFGPIGLERRREECGQDEEGVRSVFKGFFPLRRVATIVQG